MLPFITPTVHNAYASPITTAAITSTVIPSPSTCAGSPTPNIHNRKKNTVLHQKMSTTGLAPRLIARVMEL